jgi:hypothetical protein
VLDLIGSKESRCICFMLSSLSQFRVLRSVAIPFDEGDFRPAVAVVDTS